jgi:16S rRNA (guanine(966)-N(2))-methyltransferase RsmD
MKDRVRESVFNLIGPDVQGKVVIDLFAGTGAMSFEALSRGARNAVLIERHFPTVKAIRESANELGLTQRVNVVPGDAFRWAKRCDVAADVPWLVFCCPPYAFYASRRAEMVELVERMYLAAPAGSVLVVESDGRFDMSALPHADCWRIYAYPPAILALARKIAPIPAASIAE